MKIRTLFLFLVLLLCQSGFAKQIVLSEKRSLNILSLNLLLYLCMIPLSGFLLVILTRKVRRLIK